MEYGIVYLLTNPVMPGLVKIGMTTQEDIDKRMKELYTTGVPVPFECKFACKVKKSDCLKIEKALHKAFDPQRIGLQKGDVLIWKDDPSIFVTILSERKVCYQGEETSISALSAKLKGYKVKHIQPTPHWLFNDRLLSEIYDETYPFEE